MARTDIAVVNGEAKAETAIVLDDIVMKKMIVVDQPETITEAVGEPEHDLDLLTMIDTIVPLVEAVVMMSTNTGNEAPAVTAKNPKSAHQVLGRRANPQLQSLLKMSVIDVLFLSSSLRQD